MPWLGVEAGKKSREELKNLMEERGLRVLGFRSVEIKTSKGWIKFDVAEIAGFVEGYARELAASLGVVAMEAGPHLVLGEPSARLWDEAAKIVFPDGSEETVPILTYDGFLDLRVPTENVKGLKGTITIGGKVYEIPLSPDDLVEVYRRGEEHFKKVEKAVSVYGVTRIISREALTALAKVKRGPPKYEVDYEAGLAFVYEEGRIRTVSVPAFTLELAIKGFVEEAFSLFSKAPDRIKEAIRSGVKEEYEIYKSIGGLSAIRLRQLAEKIGIELEGEGEEKSS